MLTSAGIKLSLGSLLSMPFLSRAGIEPTTFARSTVQLADRSGRRTPPIHSGRGRGVVIAPDRVQNRFGEADPSRLKSVSPHNVERLRSSPWTSPAGEERRGYCPPGSFPSAGCRHSCPPGCRPCWIAASAQGFPVRPTECRARREAWENRRHVVRRDRLGLDP